MVETFKSLEKPRSGIIYFRNSDYYISKTEISHILFKAYREASWIGGVSTDSKNFVKNPEDLFNRDIDMKKFNIQTDVNDTCETTYIFKNNIKKDEKIKRIKNIFSQNENYLIIDQSYLKC